MRKNTAREADLICSQFPRAGFFVGVDGLPLQIAFRLLSVVKMRVELSAKDFLHLSEIWLESGGQWLRLNAGMVRSMRQSSIARDPASGELSVWLAGEKSFFSTANEEFPYIEFQLTKPLEITGLKIINRRDGCWERAQSLRLLLLDGVSQRWCCVYDGASNLDLADRVLEVISALTIAAPRLASSFAAADSSAPELVTVNSVVEAMAQVDSQGVSAISASFPRLLQQALKDIRILIVRYPGVADEYVPELLLIPAIARMSSSEDSAELTLYLIALHLAAGERQLAFAAYRAGRKSVQAEQRFGEIVELSKTIGRARYGFEIVPAAHAFTRSLRSWPRQTLLDELDRIEQATRLPNTPCGAFPCYGTLLGLYRDGDFIEHDDDLDLLLLVDGQEKEAIAAIGSISVVLRELGFTVREQKANGGQSVPFLQVTSKECPVHTDIFVGWRTTAGAFVLPMRSVRYEEVAEHILWPPSSWTFNDRTLFAPRDIERFLEARYGHSWTTPDPMFRIVEG